MQCRFFSDFLRDFDFRSRSANQPRFLILAWALFRPKCCVYAGWDQPIFSWFHPKIRLTGLQCDHKLTELHLCYILWSWLNSWAESEGKHSSKRSADINAQYVTDWMRARYSRAKLVARYQCSGLDINATQRCYKFAETRSVWSAISCAG